MIAQSTQDQHLEGFFFAGNVLHISTQQPLRILFTVLTLPSRRMRSEGPYEKRKRFAYPTPLPICAGYVLLESGENQSGNVHYSNETRRRIPSREAFQSFRDQRGSFLSAYSTQMCTCVNLRHAPDRTGQLSQINTQLRRP